MYNGTALWLGIRVQGPGDSGFTTIGPRQPISPTPYAINADKLDGFDSSGFTQSSHDHYVGETGMFEGEVNSDLVEETTGGATIFNFSNPFMITSPPQFSVDVVLKEASFGLGEGAAINAAEAIKGAAGNWTGFDLTLSKYSDGSSTSDTTKVFVTWVAFIAP